VRPYADTEAAAAAAVAVAVAVAVTYYSRVPPSISHAFGIHI